MKKKEGKNKRFFQMLTCMLILSLVFTLTSPIDSSFQLNTSTMKVKAATTSATAGADTFSWDNANVYFLLTDRFNNGDTANDHSYNRGLDEDGNVVDYNDTSATFHGGDFVGITEKIEEGYFDDLGVNSLWISAPYEQIHGYVIGSDDSESFAHYAYHGYYALDYTQTDANFGTAEEFQELVDTAHEHGIRVLLDIVMNHTGYNTIYDMAEYDFGTLSDGWEDTYYKSSGINNTAYHSFIDYTSSSADWANWWGSAWVRCGVAGYDAGGSTNLTMSLSGLPDFKTESASTVSIPKILQTKWNREGRYSTETAALSSYLEEHDMAMTPTNVLTYWLQSWVREYGVDGFRCDTAKHVDLTSWATLKEACVEALQDWKAENPEKALDDLDFWMTGEVWDHGVYKDEYYTQGGFDSIINFSTQGGGVLAKSSVAVTYQSYADSLNTDPDFNVLSYISSHDSVLTRGNSIYMGSAFLLLPGAVQIFYGDETDREVDDAASTNGDHEVRSDMNWDDMNEDTLAHWQKVGTFRNNHIAVGAGANASLTTDNGVAFSRIYDGDGIYDQIAACIGCTSNTEVTIDVSSLWDDGQTLVNAYDYTTAVVTDGIVTFNSGENGTVLIEEPDGKPLISVTGKAKFHGTEEVTMGISDAEYAKVSIYGAKKFLAYDGDTFTIGETAYEGDTVSVTVEATNEKGTRNATYTFYKAYADESLTEDTEEYEGILYVKPYDGTAPYVYAWKDTSTALCGAWPGTRMTEINDEGYYVMDLGTTDIYNVVLNNGSGKQSSDIKNLEGSVWIEITSSSYAYDIAAREVEAETTPITFYVDSYTGTAPYLYVWDSEGNTYNGSFPGKALTETTADGWYTLTIDSYSSSVNCIVSYGSNTNQSDNITGITEEAWITITSSDCSTYDVVKTSTSDSYYETLKKETRETKNLTAENYTDETFSVLYAYVEPADALIALGEENAEEDDLIEMIRAIQTAQAKLVVAKPEVSGIEAGSTNIYGTAAYGCELTITIGSEVYTTAADDITGEFSVTVDALALSDIVLVSCILGDNSSDTYTYNADPANNVEVTGVTLDKSSATVAPGNTITLTATVLPSNATDKTITWTTSDSSVATLSGGIITGVEEGTVTITATTSNGLMATATITVCKISATSITLSQSNLSIGTGDTATLTATVLPSNATDTVTWTTSDSSVATVSYGIITGIAEGTAAITATTSNGLTATATITVTAATSYMYFKKPSAWGATIYAYIWNDNVTYKNAVWPGVATTLYSDGVYVVEWPEDYTGTDLNVIFNDKAHQTADLEAIKNGYYTSSGYDHTVTTEEITATSVTLDQSAASVEVGDTVTLTATVLPNTASSIITWTTSDSSVATVSGGVVTGVAEGTAEIKATTTNGLTAIATITVTAATTSYMYFVKPSSWGGRIYAYMWTDDGTYKNASWPGVVTTLQSDGKYAIEYPKGHTGLNIIFNDGSNQTEDLEAIEGYTYLVN